MLFKSHGLSILRLLFVLLSLGAALFSFLGLVDLVSEWHFVAQHAGLRHRLQNVALLRDHVRQLIHLRLQEGDLLGRRHELAVVLVDVLLQLRVRILAQCLKYFIIDYWAN